MTYSLYKGGNWGAQLASIGGYGDLLEAVDGADDAPYLKAMLETGKTTNAKAVMAELQQLLNSKRSFYGSVKKTMQGMLQTLRMMNAKDGEEVVIAE